MLKIYKQYILYSLEEIYNKVLEMNFFDAECQLEELISDMEDDGIPPTECSFISIKDELYVGNYGNALDMLMSTRVAIEEDLGISQTGENQN
jgi:hypothetical protein